MDKFNMGRVDYVKKAHHRVAMGKQTIAYMEA